MEGPELKVFAGSSHPGFAEDICRHLGLPVGQREIIRFSNGQIMVKILENVREREVFVVQTAAEHVNAGLMEILIMIDALKHASARRITAVLPYMPYVRSDKKDQPRISIVARLVADLLETAGANRVLTMDLHSPQIAGFFRIPVDHLEAAPRIAAHFNGRSKPEHLVVVASDAGEAKDIGRYANRLKCAIAIIDKRRHGNNDKAVPTNLVGEVEGKDCILMDDEISTGGTVCGAAEFLMERGARSVRVGATHGVLCGDACARLRDAPIVEVVVTDTVPLAPDKRMSKIKVVTVADLFADAIRCIHNGDSVSTLFQ